MSATELVALVCCDLGSIVRGRSVLASELGEHLAGRRRLGAGQPRAHAARPARRAEPVRLDRRPAPAAGRRHARPRRGPATARAPLELVLCDIVETDGEPWECCPRQLPARGAGRARAGARRARTGAASSTSSSCCSTRRARALPFSLEAQRRAEPFAARGDGRAERGRRRAGALLRRVRARTSSRSPSPPPRASRAPTAAWCSRRSCARSPAAHGMRASFAPLLDPAQAGNGVHIHLSLLDADGALAALRRRRARRA